MVARHHTSMASSIARGLLDIGKDSGLGMLPNCCQLTLFGLEV